MVYISERFATGRPRRGKGLKAVSHSIPFTHILLRTRVWYEGCIRVVMHYYPAARDKTLASGIHHGGVGTLLPTHARISSRVRRDARPDVYIVCAGAGNKPVLLLLLHDYTRVSTTYVRVRFRNVREEDARFPPGRPTGTCVIRTGKYWRAINCSLPVPSSAGQKCWSRRRRWLSGTARAYAMLFYHDTRWMHEWTTRLHGVCVCV